MFHFVCEWSENKKFKMSIDPREFYPPPSCYSFQHLYVSMILDIFDDNEISEKFFTQCQSF